MTWYQTCLDVYLAILKLQQHFKINKKKSKKLERFKVSDVKKILI